MRPPSYTYRPLFTVPLRAIIPRRDTKQINTAAQNGHKSRRAEVNKGGKKSYILKGSYVVWRQGTEEDEKEKKSHVT